MRNTILVLVSIAVIGGCGGGKKPPARSARELALEDARNAGIFGAIQANPGAFGALGYGGADLGSAFDGDDTYGVLGGYGGFGYGEVSDDDPPPPSGDGYGAMGQGGGGGGGSGLQGPPRVETRLPTIVGALDAAVVQQYLQGRNGSYDGCTPYGEGGQVVVTFTIDGKGKATDVHAGGIAEDVAACIADQVSQIAFPKPRDGKPVQVTDGIAISRQ